MSHSPINDLRVLTLDMIDAASSGHPGMALDVAPAVYTLFRNYLNIDPEHPDILWRDRFVLSAGHVSALLYATLHMAGYAISLDDVKKFRQLGSITPGHPEVGLTPGVDCGAGPLGQGIAQGVGMAMAEKHLCARYPEAAAYLHHKTYVLCGDGCLEEGISQEAISLAGTLGLNDLILIYDANGSTLDADTARSMADDVEVRFLSAGWNTFKVADGNDVKAIDKALRKAKRSHYHPSVIIISSKIGYGSPLEGSHKSHGSPLGKEDLEKTRKGFGADYGPFEVPSESYDDLRNAIKARLGEEKPKREEAKAAFLADHPSQAEEFLSLFEDKDPELKMPDEFASDAGRNSSGKALNAWAKADKRVIGGAADVAGSVKSDLKETEIFSKEHPEGRNVYFGIREFAMASTCNGMALHGGLRPYCSCFLVFADYLKPAIRMAALQHLPVVYLFTHDSLAVGEDGPTHQPIEQLAMLRSIPGLTVLRPADEREVYAAYEYASKGKDHPVAIILSRQKLPLLEKSSLDGAARGAYEVYCPKAKARPAGEIIATGSEVNLAVEAAKLLEKEGIYLKVVSMPSMEIFGKQDAKYRDSVLSEPYEKRVSLEMGTTYGWGKYALHTIGTDEFGASGKEKDVLAHYGYTVEAVADRLREIYRA